MNKPLKRKIIKILTFKPLNVILVFILKISRLIGKNILSKYINRFPVVGEIKIVYDKKCFKMFSDGGDTITSNLYFGGINNYEPETIDLFEILSKNCNIIFDIGANSGIFSLFCSCNNEKAKVFAFEPVPRNFKYLKRNKEINNYKNMYVYDIAVTDFDGKVSFGIPDSIFLPLGGSTRNDLDEKMDSFIDVDAVTIDSFMEKNKLDYVDLFKMDTEGTEHKVLKGGKKTIVKYKPIIVCEVLPKLTEEYLSDFFRDLNYKYFHITEKGLVSKENIVGDSTFKFHNYLFITDEKLKQYYDKLKIINL